MSAGTSALFSLMVCFLVCSSEAQTNIRHEKITAERGENMVILPCKVPNNNIRAAEWSRPGMEPEYVLFYRDGHLEPNGQHESYQNRVDLQDKEMKDGNFSLILKKVKMEDTGRYVCRVFEIGKIELISNINLEVHPSGEKDEIVGTGGDMDTGNKTGIIVGSVVGGVLLAVVSVGLLIYRRHMKKNLNIPPDEPTAMEMLTVPEHHQNQVQLVSV